MTKEYITKETLKKYVGFPCIYNGRESGKLLDVNEAGEITVELYGGNKGIHRKLGYINPFIENNKISSDGWLEMIICMNTKKDCIFCDSRCKKKEPCDLFISLIKEIT
jgi:hypothetical protein